MGKRMTDNRLAEIMADDWWSEGMFEELLQGIEAEREHVAELEAENRRLNEYISAKVALLDKETHELNAATGRAIDRAETAEALLDEIAESLEHDDQLTTLRIHDILKQREQT